MKHNTTEVKHTGEVSAAEFVTADYQAEEREHLFERFNAKLSKAIWTFAEGLGGCDKAFVQAAKSNPDVGLSFKLLHEYADLKRNPVFIESAKKEARIIAEAVFGDSIVSANFKTIDALIDSLLSDDEVYFIIHVGLNEEAYRNDILNVKDILGLPYTEEETEYENTEGENTMNDNTNQNTENTEQHTEHTTTEGRKMEANTTTQNTTQNNQQTTNTTEVINMNDNTTTQQNEQHNQLMDTARLQEIIIFASRPRSSILRKLSAYILKDAEANEEQSRLVGEYGSIEGIPAPYWIDLQALKEEAAALRLALAKAFFKREVIANLFDSVYYLAVFLDMYAEDIVEALTSLKAKTAKTTTTAKVDNLFLVEVRDLTEGFKRRSDNLAKALKEAGLLVSYRRGQSDNLLEFTNIDAALNKVYAAIRRQMKKNGVELAKSNKVTKDAAKAEVLKILLRMIEKHEYGFEIIIGEAGNK